MQTKSITEIIEIREKLKDSLNTTDWELFKDQEFGNENEYSYKSLLGGLQNLLTDLNALLNNPEVCLKLTTYQERIDIKDKLENCFNYLTKPTYLFENIDELKILLRPLQLRYSKLRAVEFSKEISEVLRKKQELIEAIQATNNVRSEVTQILKSIEEDKEESSKSLQFFSGNLEILASKKESLETSIDNIAKKNVELEELIDDIQTKHSTVSESAQEIKSNEKVVDSFVKKIEAREIQMEKLEVSTNSYLKKLTEFTTERTELLNQAANLIETAKQALNYKTAEGLSASFKSQYDEERNANPKNWIIASLACLAVAIGVGVWILLDQKGIEMLIGRIVLIPLPIAGAIFCANQYIKQQNIIQDYAYKMVLAKSIVGFSEQFKKYEANNGDYSNYLQKVLNEIHQDPLRKRSKDSIEKGDLKSDDKFDKLLDFAKDIVNKSSTQ